MSEHTFQPLPGTFGTRHAFHAKKTPAVLHASESNPERTIASKKPFGLGEARSGQSPSLGRRSDEASSRHLKDFRASCIAVLSCRL